MTTTQLGVEDYGTIEKRWLVHSTRADTWLEAARLLRERAGSLYASGDDETAYAARTLATWLSNLPIVADELKQAEALSVQLDRLERNVRKAE